MSDFRQIRSSIDAVIDIVSAMKPLRMTRRFSEEVFLDINGAFDCLTRSVILSALVDVGLGGRFQAWVANYMKCRMIFISTDDGNTRIRIAHGIKSHRILSKDVDLVRDTLDNTSGVTDRKEFKEAIVAAEAAASHTFNAPVQQPAIDLH